MQKRTTIQLVILSIIFTFGLTGCAHNPSAPVVQLSSSASSKTNIQHISTNYLPTDYPTRAIPDGNIWDDIRDNLQLYNYSNVKQVKNQIYWFQTHQKYLYYTLIRGAQYIYFINELAKKYHLPSDVVLIPIFESGYVPNNRNHSSGATGLWQFMPATARGYGLRINSYYDGRSDPIQSSYAAMKHFSYLHYFFNNDWTLTFAAYDAGEGTIQNAMFRNQRNGLPLNYWALRFPRYETYEYVPKLLALSAIIKDPGRYGINLPAINNGPYFEQVNIGKSITLEQAARLANTSVTVMHNLNPAYLRYRIPPTGPFVISVPTNKVAIFKNNLAGKVTAIESENNEEATNNQENQVQEAQENNTEQTSQNLSKNLANAAAEEKAAIADDDQNQNNNDSKSHKKSSKIVSKSKIKQKSKHNLHHISAKHSPHKNLKTKAVNKKPKTEWETIPTNHNIHKNSNVAKNTKSKKNTANVKTVTTKTSKASSHKKTKYHKQQQQ